MMFCLKSFPTITIVLHISYNLERIWSRKDTLHTSNVILDEVDPSGSVTYGTSRNSGRMCWFLTHLGIVHEVT